MARLLLFNPEHDYALANGGPYYIPPAAVKLLSSRLQYLPMVWAQTGDFILRADNIIQSYPDLKSMSVKAINDKLENIETWGWNPALRHRLLSLGIRENLLPDLIYLNTLRQLSHRRISISCNRFLSSPIIPTEIDSVSEAEKYAAYHRGCFFKLPWSSGGRGVLATIELNSSQIKEWVTGGIRRQGSILAEPFIDRSLDFASLWTITDGIVGFDGLSVSLSDGRGKYKGNLLGTQEDLSSYISRFTSNLSSHIIDRQKEFISNKIAPFYNGKLGIDMACDKNGTVYPCIEVNLRRTMGHVAMDYLSFLQGGKSLPPGIKLPLINIKDI